MDGKQTIDSWRITGTRGRFRYLDMQNFKLANETSSLNFTLGSGGTSVTNSGILDFDSPVQFSNLIRFPASAVVQGLSTDDLDEASNLFYTDARARAAISSADSRILYNAAGELSLNLPVTDTIYSADGTLAASRTVDLNSFYLTFNGRVITEELESSTLGEGVRLSHTYLNNNTSSEIFFMENELGDSGAKLRFDGSANTLYLSTIQAGTELPALAVARSTGDCKFGYNVEAAGTLGSMTAGRGIRLSHDYNGDDTSSEIFFIENDDERFGARLKYDAPTNHLRLSMMNWGTEYEIMSVSRTSQTTTFESLVRIRGSLNLDYVGDTAPQLELRDSDQVRTASFRMPGPADPVGNDTLLIQNNRGQQDIVFSTENGGDFRFVQDYSTDAPLDRTSFYIGHANVASSTTITDPFVRVGHSSMNSAELQVSSSDGSVILRKNSTGLAITNNGTACFEVDATNKTLIGQTGQETVIRGHIVRDPSYGQLTYSSVVMYNTGSNVNKTIPKSTSIYQGTFRISGNAVRYDGATATTMQILVNIMCSSLDTFLSVELWTKPNAASAGIPLRAITIDATAPVVTFCHLHYASADREYYLVVTDPTNETVTISGDLTIKPL